MKGLNFSRRTIILALSFVILITILGLNFEEISIKVDGKNYFIIFSALIGIFIQFLKKDKSKQIKK